MNLVKYYLSLRKMGIGGEGGGQSSGGGGGQYSCPLTNLRDQTMEAPEEQGASSVVADPSFPSPISETALTGLRGSTHFGQDA